RDRPCWVRPRMLRAACRRRRYPRRPATGRVSFFCSLGCRLLAPRALLGLLEQELADQFLDHHGRLRLGDPIAIGQHLRIAARIEPDVDLSEQSRGIDRGDGVPAELVLIVDTHGYHGIVGLGVEAHLLDPSDDHAGGLHRRPQLQAADVLEVRFDTVARRPVERQQISYLEGEEQNGAEADRHENAHPEVDRGAVHTLRAPRNMNTVMTKSSARMASEEMTTVRVVALATPSAVGFASKPSNTAISDTAAPNTKLLMMPLVTSGQKSTPACIWPQNAPASMPISRTPTT